MSPFTPPPPLTPQRIRAVIQRYPDIARRIRGLSRRGGAALAGFPRIPDFAAGETANDVFTAALRPELGDDADVQRDYMRIQEILSILARGTLDDEIGRMERLLAAQPGDFGTRTRLEQLQRIRPYEAQAVLDSLDALEGEFALDVHAARRRYFPEQLREETEAAAADRTGDPRRPPLTEERVRLLLELMPRFGAPVQRMVRDFMRLDELGADARKRLGVRASKAADEQAGGAEAFARDVFWLLFIGQRTRGGRTIDSWMAEFRVQTDPDAWGGSNRTISRKMKNIAAFASSAAEAMVRLFSLVGRDEEAAVNACRAEYDRALAEVLRGGARAPTGRGAGAGRAGA